MGIMEAAATVLVAALGGRSLIDYVRDRRKSKADGSVAEATVELRVDAMQLENAEARLQLAQKTWDGERASLERRVKALENDLSNERLESAQKDGKILALEERVSQIQDQLVSVLRELADLRSSA
jgi:chromosome segregation ATPase